MNRSVRKSRLLTYFFSFIPGVGFMYRGWMKKGFSYLTLFFITICLVEWFEISLFLVIPTLIWFYAFFDHINTFSLTEEESKELQDAFLFQKWMDKVDVHIIKNNHRLFGGGFVFLGSYLMMKYITKCILVLLPKSFEKYILSLMEYTPYLMVSCIILYCGISFIRGKVELFHLLRKADNSFSLQKKSEELFRKSGVVYYMEQGDLHKEDSKKVEEEKKVSNDNDFEEILNTISREQLIRKAKELLEDETYVKIHNQT